MLAATPGESDKSDLDRVLFCSKENDFSNSRCSQEKENKLSFLYYFIEKSPFDGYITEEGVSTGKSKNEQYQKFKI